MHYGDPKHLEKALLQIVIYKHLDLTKEFAKKAEDFFHYEICSIYKCQYMDMYLVHELWDNFDVIFKKELKKLKEEQFYLVTLTIVKNKLKWSEATEVTDKMFKKDPFLGLH